MKISISLSSTPPKLSMPDFKKIVKDIWPAAHKFSTVEGVGQFAELHGGMGKACSNLQSKGYKEQSSKGVNEHVYTLGGTTLCISEDDGKTIVYAKIKKA